VLIFNFHYSIQQLCKSETDIIQQHFTSSILSNRNRDFCSEGKRMKNCNSKVTGIVGVADNNSDSVIYSDTARIISLPIITTDC